MAYLCDEITEAQARRRRDEIMVAVNSQVFTLKGQIAFSDFVTIYRERHLPTLASGPKKKYDSLLRNHLVPALGTMRLSNIDTRVVQDFLNQKQSEKLSWWTRNDLKGIISGIFTKAADWDYWSGTNPALRTSLGPKRTARKKYGLEDEQIVALINELTGSVQLAVATAVSTGVRISELAGLKWGSVDLNEGSIFVQETFFRGERGETKTEESHRDLSVGLLAAAFRALKPSNSKPDDYVFVVDGKPIDDRHILRRFIRPAAERLGFHFEGFGWRTFRRLNITAIQDGPDAVNVFEAMKQAGHAKPETTMKYTLLRSAVRDKAIRGLQKRWIPADYAGILREPETVQDV